MKKITALLPLYLLILITSCGKGQAPPEDMVKISIYNTIGTVKIISVSSDSAAKSGQALIMGDTLVTGSASLADISYGNRGIIRISENSELRIDSIALMESGNTDLDLKTGRIHGVLKKLGNTGVEIKTPTIVASVRGTTFSIASDRKKSRVSVAKGKIEVKPVNRGKVIAGTVVLVKEKQSIEIDKDTTEKIAAGGEPKLAAVAIKREEIIEIKDALKDMKPELIKGLDEEVKKEIEENKKIDVSVKKPCPPRISEAELLKKKEEELALKAAEDERIRKETEERERIEKLKRLEQEKRDKVSNIPTL